MCLYPCNSEYLYKDYIVIKPQKITKAYLITRGHLWLTLAKIVSKSKSVPYDRIKNHGDYMNVGGVVPKLWIISMTQGQQ